MRHRPPVLALLVVVLAGAIASSAAADTPFTTSQVTSPADPWFTLNHPSQSDPGGNVDVQGTTNGAEGDPLALICTYGSGSQAHRLVVDSNLTLDADGTFSATERLSTLALQTCVLRAVPASTTSGDLSAFAGPRVGVGQADNEEDVATPTDATHGLPRPVSRSTDYFTAVSQLSGYMEWQSASSCGLSYAYPYDGTFGFSGSSNIADEPLFDCAGALYPVGTGDDQSDIRIDDESVLTPYGAWTVDAQGGGGGPPRIPVEDFPSATHSNTIDPLTGDTTITENEPLSYCLRNGNPVAPNSLGCDDLAPADAHLTRTIVQSQGGGVATVTDSFVNDSTVDRDLTVTYDQHVGRDATAIFETNRAATQPTFSLDGGPYEAQDSNTPVTLGSDVPGVIGIQGDPNRPDGTSDPQGAIVYATTPDDTEFRYANGSNLRNGAFTGGPQADNSAGNNPADLEMTYDRTLPGSGSVGLTHSYVQALTRAGADALVGVVRSSYTTPSVAIDSPTDEQVLTSADVVASGTASDPFSPVTLTVNGQAVSVDSDGTWSAPLVLAPGRNTITAVATNAAGKTSQVQSTAIYTPPTVPPPTDTPGTTMTGTTTTPPDAPVPAPVCAVPSLEGVTRVAAEQAIVAAHCTVGTVRTERSATVRAGSVIAFTPSFGMTLGNSYPVDLIVSSGPASSAFSVSTVATTTTRSSRIVVGLLVGDAGDVEVLATYGAPGGVARSADLRPGKHQLTFASGSATLHRGGPVVFHLMPRKTAKATLLRRRKHHQRLTVRVRVRFTPVNGHPSTKLVKTLRLR